MNDPDEYLIIIPAALAREIVKGNKGSDSRDQDAERLTATEAREQRKLRNRVDHFFTEGD